MSIYLRHGAKMYDNNTRVPFSLDSPLSRQGQREIRNTVPQYLEMYGIPESIYCSPLLRTRMTADIIQELVRQQHGKIVPIIIEPSISEYLGNQKHKNIFREVYAETWNGGIIMPEEWEQFQERIAQHIQTFKDVSNCWYITHGLFIQELAKSIGYNMDYPTTFAGLRIENNQGEFM